MFALCPIHFALEYYLVLSGYQWMTRKINFDIKVEELSRNEYNMPKEYKTKAFESQSAIEKQWAIVPCIACVGGGGLVG